MAKPSKSPVEERDELRAELEKANARNQELERERDEARTALAAAPSKEAIEAQNKAVTDLTAEVSTLKSENAELVKDRDAKAAEIVTLKAEAKTVDEKVADRLAKMGVDNPAPTDPKGAADTKTKTTLKGRDRFVAAIREQLKSK
ncbi:MAG: hypothetical protein JO317_06460 [Verrucomicrobiae bacterium]|nr:hypothetical protein [Verrucomicrobiae bacterium]